MTAPFDAEQYGARCSRCYLRTVRVGGPIGPEMSRRARVALIGEAPGKEEIEVGRPFVGPAGHELTTSLASVAVARDDVSILSAVGCRPPGNDLEMVMHRCQQTNKRLIAAGQQPFLNPIEACRPMVQHFLGAYSDVVTVGKVAMRSLTQMQSSIMDMRGAPVTGVLSAAVDKDGVRPWLVRETLAPGVDDPAIAAGGKFMRLLPTIHPSFVMRQRRWTNVFRSDLSRAFRWFRGGLGWRDPAMNLRPTLSEARDFLYSGAPFYAYDVETDAKESLLARLRCIGFGTPDAAIVIPLLSVDGQTRFYAEDEHEAMLEMLRAWFTDRKIIKVGWNCLAGGTRVILADGSSLPIEQIVRRRLDVKVKALDAQGHIVHVPVQHYHRFRRPQQAWRVIEIVGQKAHARGLTVTPDHRIWTARGWIEAADVVAGDTLFVDEPALTEAQRQAILGTALGDSRVEISNTRREAAWAESPTAFLRGGHTAESGLTTQKVAALPFLTPRMETSKGYGGPMKMAQYASPTTRQIGALLPLLYDGAGARRIKPETLAALGPVGLAWWFMDDGNLMSRASLRRPDVVQLALHRYSPDDREVAKAWFTARYGQCWLSTRGDLLFSRGATKAFADEVASHVFPEARYKLPADWRGVTFRPVTPSRHPEPLAVRVRATYDYVPPRGTPRKDLDADTSWCLTTETGNFFTNFGLVHNCGMYDRIVIETRLGVTPAPLVDGILIHRNVDSELPHNLAFVGAMFTDVARAWKASHAATGAESDHELHVYNCLHRGTRVVLEDGSTESIENLVRAKYAGAVMACEGGRIVSRRVVGWHQQRRPGQEWLAVKHALCNQNERGVVSTPDHVFIERHRGRVEAQHLQPGDEIALPEIMWSKEQSQAILGTLLGDSTLVAMPSQRGGTPTSYALRCGHAAAGGLAPYKIAALAPHAKAGKGRPAGVVRFKGRAYPQDAVEEVLTPNLRSLALLAPHVYAGRKRRLRVEALEWMGPVGWAWWFMDDGCRQKGQRRVQNTGERGGATHNPETVTLATNGFPREDIDVALAWFRARFGPTWAGKDKVLRLGRKATLAFCAALAPHLPPQARYKLPRDAEWPAFAGPPARPNGAPVWVKVESVEPFVPSRRTAVEKWNAEQRYCLTVEGAHNFFTTAGLVKNCGDVVVNARIMQPLVDACTLKGQMQVVAVDHKAQSICVGYHKNGIYVDQAVRRELDVKYRKEAQEHLHIARMSTGDVDFNPNSVMQVRELLFEKWSLTPLETTKLGDPSTNDDTLRKLLLLPSLKQEQKDFLRSMRKFRRASKFRGTFIHPLRPFDEPLYEDDPYAVDVNTVEGAALLDEVVNEVVEDVQGDLSPRAIRRAMKKAVGKVLADGRHHSNWNVHTPTTGRKASSDMNVQNIPRVLRAMFSAEEGRALVGSDYDQLELRISAAYAGAERYLQAFRDGLDPHAITSEAIYGAAFRNGSEKDKKRIRDFAKRFVYAVIYGATVETIHETIAAAEDDKGNLIFPWVTLRETDTLFRRWMNENPEYGAWWESTIATYRRDGFLEEPVSGRRRFFLDGEDRNEIINYRVQAAGASCVTKAEIMLVEGPLPSEKYGPGTGLIHNGHDALIAECPCVHLKGKPYKGKDALHGGHPPLAPGERCPIVDAANAIKDAMTMRLAGYEVMLTATPKIGFRFSEV